MVDLLAAQEMINKALDKLLGWRIYQLISRILD